MSDRPSRDYRPNEQRSDRDFDRKDNRDSRPDDRGDRFKRDDHGRDDNRRDDSRRDSRPDDRFKRDDRGDRRPASRDSRDSRDSRPAPRFDSRDDRGDRRPDDRGDRFKRDDRGRDDSRRDDSRRDSRPDDRFKRDDRRPFSRDDRGDRRPDDRGDRFKRDDRRPDDRGDRKPGRRFEGDRRDFQRDDGKKDFRKDRDFKDRGDARPRGDRGDARGDAPRMGVMDLIREADVELLRMLTRRTRLREKLSERQAGAKERDLRTAWEEAAARVSRDPRLLRDMFTLLQQIEVNAPDVDAPQAFTLTPSSDPANVDLPVPASTRQTRLRMALAAGAGAPLRLNNALLNTEVVACLKMFNCAGASLRWEENPDRVECAQTGPICGFSLPVLDKVIYVGDDAFNFYLMLFQLLTRPSRVKFMGESALRFLDISPLRRFLTVLGARLTSVVPGEDGLPARMESSAVLPGNIAVPADVPADAVVALLAATPFWTGTVRVDLEARPDVGVGEILPLLRACGCTVEDNGVALTITPPARLTMPEGDDMDLLAAFPLLAFAGCTGGTSTVRGHWPKDHPCAAAALTLLRSVSTVEVTDDCVTATALPKAETEGVEPETADFSTLPQELLGPALALYLLRHRNAETLPLPVMPALDETDDAELVDGFLAVLGYARSEDSLKKIEPVRVPWAAPSAWWGMGMVLASFGFPRLRMANPAIITALLPQFWGMFNALPEPGLERPKTEEENAPEAPRRRRVLAGFMPESEMPPALDYEDEE